MNALCRMRRTLSGWMLGCTVGLGVLPLPRILPAQSLRVSGTPSLRLSSPESGSGMFETVVGATRLGDGRIVVGNRGEHALLVFSPTGQFERALVRKGRGPGEVSALLALYRCGDRVFTSDIVGDRMQIFSPTLAFERAFRFRRNAYRRACNANGDFVHMGWDVGASQSPVRQTVDYWIAPADSSVGISLGALPGDERAGAMPQPLGASPRVAIGANRAYIALSDSLSILTFALDGKRGATLRAPFERIRVSEVDVRAALERDVRVVGEQARASVAAMHATSPRKTLLPATRDMLVDSEGLIWIQRYPEAGKPTVNWTVFRADGRVHATVPLPRDFDVFEVGRDYLLGSAPDRETDMPLILLYAITR